MGLATQMLPSWSRQIPSGATSPVGAQTRRLDNEPSAAMSNAVRRKHLRGAADHGEVLLVGADIERALRSRRSGPPLHVTAIRILSWIIAWRISDMRIASAQKARQPLMDEVLPSRLAPFPGELGNILGEGLDPSADQGQLCSVVGLRQIPFGRTNTGITFVAP